MKTSHFTSQIVVSDCRLGPQEFRRSSASISDKNLSREYFEKFRCTPMFQCFRSRCQGPCVPLKLRYMPYSNGAPLGRLVEFRGMATCKTENKGVKPIELASGLHGGSRSLAKYCVSDAHSACLYQHRAHDFLLQYRSWVGKKTAVSCFCIHSGWLGIAVQLYRIVNGWWDGN
jgi:hypothetical protein